ncbi:hypothetical protein [Aeromicrobium wangtongii]|uniref:hypothetical protein n=1 Tax=Aeromicrobium wangtongii TaxID=2969247 RepID=UPI0020175652|nr:hypothetical protein [Aeromicrobium wangtongii]MCL3819068.1 hypothetical protein [Aeromicrobium wangtongii]
MMWLIVAQVTVCVLVLIGLGFVVAMKWIGTLTWMGVQSLRHGLPALRAARPTPRPVREPSITSQGPAVSRFAAFAANVRQHRDA